MTNPETSDSLLRRAISAHQKNELEDADRLYRQVLTREPESVDALHFYGVCRYDQGDVEQAVEMISKAIELNPAYPDAYLNLGNILLSLGAVNETYACFAKAFELAPTRPEVLTNLGIMLRYRGNAEVSERLLTQVVEMLPDLPQGHYNLGNTQHAQRKLDAARCSFRRALDLDEDFTEAYTKYTQLCYMSGHSEEALDVLDKRLAKYPANPILKHMRAAISGEDTPARASSGYLQALFDQFAKGFERNLHNLEYQGPSLMGQALKRYVSVPAGDLAVLDAGCGTGLSAAILRPYAKHLLGVDISQGMLGVARGKECYDELQCGDLLDHLKNRSKHYDLIVSIDVLVYFGVLEEILLAVSGALTPGGLFIFTLEREAEGNGYRLNPHGRYSHTEAYLENGLRSAGLEELELRQTIVRKELGKGVDSLIVVARRPRR